MIACLLGAELVLLINLYLEDDGVLTLKFLHRVHKDNLKIDRRWAKYRVSLEIDYLLDYLKLPSD